jgi:uncharacterized protein (TIGR02687 family)
MSKIVESLERLFNQHRVILWYDPNLDFKEDIHSITIQNVEKIECDHNPFEVKVRIYKEESQKFLLYLPYEKPSNESNWLLDIELAYHVFHTDQEALFLQELGLDYAYKGLISDHFDFFKSKERVTKLKEILGSGDEHIEIRYKMLSIVFGTDQLSLYSFILSHLNTLSNENHKIDKDLEKYNLKDFYWNQVRSYFRYESENPNIFEFIIEIFSSTSILDSKEKGNKEGRVLLSQWKDSISYRDSFKILSHRVSEVLNIDDKLESTDYELVLGEDHFELIDKKVISSLIDRVTNSTIKFDTLRSHIKQRESTFWYFDFENFYLCILYSSQLFELISKYKNKTFSSIESGVKEYESSLYKVDQLYRKIIWSYRQADQNRVLYELYRKVEKAYSNDWLLSINNEWQRVVDNKEEWPFKSSLSQQSFFKTHLKSNVSSRKKYFVIISDALRYECAEELSSMIQNENRYQSSIESMIGSVPSYTQLGMASLLPRSEKLEIKEESDLILVDGMVSTGISGRGKILSTNSDLRTTAITREDYIKLNSVKEGRELTENNDLIYIFSNSIDKRGDDKTTEVEVFDAVNEELNNLIDLIKKIANNNGNNIIITTDHGFIYQHHEIDESDFSKSNFSGDVWKSNRRFVIGKNLKSDDVCKSYKGDQLGLQSDIDVLVPKSINRLRVQGSGSQFVHGGSTLQEITIPLIKISKKREDTTRQVDVDIIQTTDRITSNLISISFIQSEVVSEVVHPRVIRSGIYIQDGDNEVLLSDSFKYEFDFSEGLERQREVRHTFTLTSKASGQYKNQRVRLILEEPINGTNKWRKYKEFQFSLNISFTNDFDDF